MDLLDKLTVAITVTQKQYNIARLTGLLDNVFIDVIRKQHPEWKDIKKKEILFQKALKAKKL